MSEQRRWTLLSHQYDEGWVDSVFDGSDLAHGESIEACPVSELDAALAERDMLRTVIAWANNSLYGSHGFFLSSNGGPANEHHLDSQIEKVKAYSNEHWHLFKAAEAERDALKSENARLVKLEAALRANMADAARASEQADRRTSDWRKFAAKCDAEASALRAELAEVRAKAQTMGSRLRQWAEREQECISAACAFNDPASPGHSPDCPAAPDFLTKKDGA